MKKLLILISVLAFCLSLNAQDVISVSGHVTDIQTSQPIAGHQVYIFSNNQVVNDILITDINGYYSDSIFETGVTIESLNIYTYDCNIIVHDTTVTNFDNPIVVDFIICNDSLPSFCQADFIALVDSTSNTPNFYYFYDNSLGNISEWLWDFGDGTISLEQNPVHQYAESGTYEVCLTIICENAGGYVDFICKQITTPNYYNLGGFTFAGDYPINNPVSTADTGIAYLYRVFNNTDIVAIDTNIFYTLGYFWFTEKMEGDYLIKISLTPNSAHFNEYIPTYFIDGMMWENTNTLSLYDSSYFAVDVHLLQANGTNQGNGKIGGNVIWYDDSLINPVVPIPDVEILLLDNENNPLTFNFSENDGYFEFNYLAFGTYKLYAEFTGKYTLPVTVTITDSHPIINDIILEVCDHEITGIEDIFYEPDIIISNVFPNPATNNLNIEINLKNSQNLSLNISNLLGQIIYFENFNLSQGNHIIKMSVRSLQKGIYLLSVSNSDNLISVTKKIVKN